MAVNHGWAPTEYKERWWAAWEGEKGCLHEQGGRCAVRGGCMGWIRATTRQCEIIGFMGQLGECSETACSLLPHRLSCIFLVSWKLLVGAKLHLCFSVLRIRVMPVRRGGNLLFSLNLLPKWCRGCLLIFSLKAAGDDSSLLTLHWGFSFKQLSLKNLLCN